MGRVAVLYSARVAACALLTALIAVAPGQNATPDTWNLPHVARPGSLWDSVSEAGNERRLLTETQKEARVSASHMGVCITGTEPQLQQTSLLGFQLSRSSSRNHPPPAPSSPFAILMIAMNFRLCLELGGAKLCPLKGAEVRSCSEIAVALSLNEWGARAMRGNISEYR